MYDTKEIFKKALYNKRSTSIPSFLEVYEENLISKSTKADESSYYLKAHANRIRQYRKDITNAKYQNEIKKNFNNIYNFIVKNFPDLQFSIEGRRKSVVSTDKKILKNINEQKSLDLLRDTTGFRIILFGNNSPELITMCYTLMNHIIQHNEDNDFIICTAEDLCGICENPHDLEKTIMLPEKSLIPSCYQHGVKDYILQPKENGYQSLHAAFRNDQLGGCFEIQIRTFDMHMHAESGDAKHSVYKEKKYKTSDDVFFDREKVTIPGYKIGPDGNLFDYVGLEKSITIFSTFKTI